VYSFAVVAVNGVGPSLISPTGQALAASVPAQPNPPTLIS